MSRTGTWNICRLLWVVAVINERKAGKAGKLSSIDERSAVVGEEMQVLRELRIRWRPKPIPQNHHLASLGLRE